MSPAWPTRSIGCWKRWWRNTETRHVSGKFTLRAYIHPVPPVRILHCHSTFSLGGKEARAVRLMNSLGEKARHVVLSASPGELGARAAIAAGIAVDFPNDAPSLAGRPGPKRYAALARYMAGFDLVLTYNWGAMDAVMAHRLSLRRLPPLIHHEDGFNADESGGQKTRRILFRRLALTTAHALVVPSQTLETIARRRWGQPAQRVHRIANGIPIAHYAARPRPGTIPGLAAMPEGITIGTLAGLREIKNLPRLVRAFAASGVEGRLVIVGEGPERDHILDVALTMGVAGRVLLPGFLPDPARYVGLFDIFALSSDSEQYPISLVEAMAAGLPAVATDVGDIKTMVSARNLPFIVAPANEADFGAALARLAGDPALRRRIGAANRLTAARNNDEQAMIAAYRALYSRALGDGRLL